MILFVHIRVLKMFYLVDNTCPDMLHFVILKCYFYTKNIDNWYDKSTLGGRSLPPD